MTDLDDFRAVLRGPATSPARPAPLGDIMVAGRRLRRRRRVTAASLALVLLAAVGGTVSVLRQESQPTAADGRYSPAGSWGAAVQTGIHQPAGEVVITATRVRSDVYPDVTLGIRGCFAADGSGDRTVSGCHEVYDTPDRTPGFHNVNIATAVDQYGDLPMFGYFIGPAVSITAKADGRRVMAQTAAWSEDPNVVLFWFPLDQIPAPHLSASPGSKAQEADSPKMTGWAAYAEDGRSLPTGRVRTYAG